MNDTTKKVLGLLAIYVLGRLSKGTPKYTYGVVRESDRAIGFHDCSSAIMNSSMFGSDKDSCMEKLLAGKPTEYYEAFFDIVSDDSTFGSDKVSMVTKLSEKFE